MKKKNAAAAFLSRIQDILEELDELAEDAGLEELDELNAQLEDALFLLECVEDEDEDAAEEYEGALEEILSLAGDYRALCAEIPELQDRAQELSSAAEMARLNLL